MPAINDADAIYLGDRPVDRVYLGDTLVWSPASAAPAGEAILTASGSWQCPPGVTSVSVVCIGKGGNGLHKALADITSTLWGGGGGGLCYKNDIPVTPGQLYAATVNGSVSAILGLQANAGTAGRDSATAPPGGTASGGDANFSGGAGSSTGPMGRRLGGGAGQYDANGGAGTGANTSPFGIGVPGPPWWGGGGASALSAGSRGDGAPGGIRIIWGEGRSFPDNAQPLE